MKTIYFEFDDHIKDDGSLIDLYLEPAWEKSNCPISKVPVLVNGMKSVHEFYKKLFTAFTKKEIDSQTYLEQKRRAATMTTIRVCPGIKSVLDNSTILTSPCDIEFMYNREIFEAVCSDDHLAKVVLHVPQQHSIDGGRTSIFGDVWVPKIDFPITLKTIDESLMWLHPQYHGPTEWQGANGIVNSDIVKACPLNVILLVPLPKKNETQTLFIKKGTPLAYLWSPKKIQFVKGSAPKWYKTKFVGAAREYK